MLFLRCVVYLLWFTGSMAAANFTVNSTADTVDQTPGDGKCFTGTTLPTGQPECTLRAAIQETNALAGPDGITLPAGIYKAVTPAFCRYRNQGDPNFESVTRPSLCITGELSISGAGAVSTVIDGVGGTRVLFVSTDAKVTLQGLTIRNGAFNTGTFNGGGAGINNQGDLTLANSAVINNVSGVGGGGIYSNGKLTVSDSEISNNVALLNSGDGAGILVAAGSLAVSNTTFDGNSGSNGGAGIAMYQGNLSVTGSTFSNGVGFGGAGIRVYSGTAFIGNSTFYGNRTSNAGSAIRNDGSGFVTLSNVTVSGNRTDAIGGAILGAMYLRNSLIAGNTTSDSTYSGDCISIPPNSMVSQGYNLIQDVRTCNISGDATGNLFGNNGGLGAFSLNGGSTKTVSLLATSAALDAGSPAVPGSGGYACGAFDQRGILRPQQGRCDIGAFERNPGFRVTGITPSRGGAGGSVVVVISGSGFLNGASVRLRRSGQPDVVGTATTTDPGGYSLSSSFDLSSVAQGAYDVAIANAGGESVTLSAAFSVQPPDPPKLWSTILGRSALRPAALAKYQIVFGNRGNVDAYNVPITISVPANLELSLLTGVAPPPAQAGQVQLDWSVALLAVLPYSANGQLTVPLMLPVIPAGFTGYIEFEILLPANAVHGGSVSLSAVLGDPLSNPNPDPAAFASMVAGAIGYANQNLGVTVPPTASSVIQTYVTNQLQAAIAAGRTSLVSTLGSRPLVFSLSQLITDAGYFAAALAHAQPAARVAVSSGGPCFNLLGLGEGASCGDAPPTPAKPPDQPNPIGPIQCLQMPEHHRDGDKCVPDKGANCARDPKNCTTYPIVDSIDPNEKTGPRHGNSLTAQPSGNALSYRISFENLPTATGAAQTVSVTDQLDIGRVDLTTFSFGVSSFGNYSVAPPPGLTSYNTVIDLRPAKDFLVKLEAALNITSGLITWRFSTLDPMTAQATTDPVLGFLPPDTAPPGGQGSVSFSVLPKKNSASGIQVCNQASIVFDVNPAINTNSWCNTLDDIAPLSKVQALSAQQTSTSFNVQWSGTDTGSTIDTFDIFASDNGGAFQPWLLTTGLTQSFYQGSAGHSYAFYSIATDQAGNREQNKTIGEASTTLTATPGCAADVTSQYNIVRGGFRRDSTGLFIQTVNATTNSGMPAPPGLRFVLSSVSAGVTLANATGKTVCGVPFGSPYILFPAGAASGSLQFANPNNLAITYILQLFSPTGSI